MILELGNFWRQFWNAVSEYFPGLFISLPLIGVFGGKIVLKPPNLWILVSCNFLNIWARKMLKIFLKIALNLYTFLLLEMYIGFRILKTVFESSYTLRIVVTFLIFELEKSLRYFWKLQWICTRSDFLKFILVL